MIDNRKLAEMAGKILSKVHERYREMCTLAAVGQLGGPQMCELDEHIATCVPCREYLKSVVEASMLVMPVLADSRVATTDGPLPAGMRARFLSRLAAEANTKDDELPLPFRVVGKGAPHDSLSVRDENQAGEHDAARVQRQASLAPVWRSAAVLAACAVVGISGFYLGHRHSTGPLEATGASSQPSGPRSQSVASSGSSDRFNQLENDRRSLLTELDGMKAKLSAADAEQKELAEKLAEANSKLVGLSAQQRDALQGTTRGDQGAKEQVAALQSEVETLRRQSDESQLKLAAQQDQNQELRAKLDLTEANLQQELQLKSAKNEMGALVAARDLHIVDVYDADPNGKRQRAFGRVFYVEGKSLVFYAYDLDDAHQHKANVVFHVWGGKAGVKEMTHSLGILNKDGNGDSRWAMTFDDPNVLAQINSVFVTAESTGQASDAPHGKKILYAYFGTQPNHP
jgi:hypothetical protein